MSRNIRKLQGQTLPLVTADVNSDDDYEPLYSKPTSSQFQGLELSSHSDSDHRDTDNEDTEHHIEEAKKKRKKKKKQKKKVTSDPVQKNMEQMDEIDKLVLEVNEMLGSPPKPSGSADNPAIDPEEVLLSVQQKHVNVANEMKRLFGSDPAEERRRGRQPNQSLRHLKKNAIIPTEYATNAMKSGLSMSIQRRENGLTYFTFDHSKEYQKMHRSFLQIAKLRAGRDLIPYENPNESMHVEALLEDADTMFRVEEYTSANTMIEEVIAYMQHVAHPSFNITDRKVRLEYKYMENRVFHVALLKYIHLLTNRACHRTALELAKVLLNLDPTDPLAVVLIIDVLALRAREHQWLVDAIDLWQKKRDAGFLFNIQYSYALANYHVAVKNKGDLSRANSLLQNAIMYFPTVVPIIFECANLTPSAKIKEHSLFGPESEKTTTQNLKDLILLYAKLSWARWREPIVLEWLTKNANELIDKYNADDEIKELVKKYSNERLNLFQAWPIEVTRHLSIIKPMANLLVDGAVPQVKRGLSCDPVPPSNGVNRYNYGVPDTPEERAASSSLLELFLSILPHYDIPVPPELQQQIMDAMENPNVEDARNERAPDEDDRNID